MNDPVHFMLLSRSPLCFEAVEHDRGIIMGKKGHPASGKAVIRMASMGKKPGIFHRAGDMIERARNWMKEYAYLVTIMAVIAIIAASAMYTRHVRVCRRRLVRRRSARSRKKQSSLCRKARQCPRLRRWSRVRWLS